MQMQHIRRICTRSLIFVSIREAISSMISKDAITTNRASSLAPAKLNFYPQLVVLRNSRVTVMTNIKLNLLI